MIVKKTNIPSKSLLKKINYDYFDSYCSLIINKPNLNPLNATKYFFSSSPKWVEKLFLIRNKIVNVIGLKSGNSSLSKKEIIANFKGNVGERIGLFKVYSKSDDEIIIGEDDKHLNFRVSLFLDGTNHQEKSLYISTVVVFNNWFGRLYFLLVKPFHKVIVKVMFKNIVKHL